MTRRPDRSLPRDIPPATTKLLTAAAEPGFPSLDWRTNPKSFAAMTAFWSGLFAIAAGEQAADYRSALLPGHEEWSHALHVVMFNRSRRVLGQPCAEGVDFGIFWNDGDEFGDFPDRAELAIDAAMERDNVMVAAAIMRVFVNAEIASWEAARALEARLKRDCRRFLHHPVRTEPPRV